MRPIYAKHNSWFYARVLMTGLLAAMLVIGRLPAAGAVEEAAGQTAAAQDSNVKVEATEAPTEPAPEPVKDPAPEQTEAPPAPTPASTNQTTVDTKDDTQVSTDPSPQRTARRDATKVAGADSIETLAAPAPAVVVSDGTNPSADLDQWANLNAGSWQNGNLNGSNSSYVEGDTVPFRMRLDGLGAGVTHTLTVEWDVTKSSTHAYDYIRTYNASESPANPCSGSGVVSCVEGAPTSSGDIPLDPQVTVPQAAGAFKMWGADITSVSGYSGTGVDAADGSRRITVTFTSMGDKAVMAWGGHISSRIQWNPQLTAAQISGSPYHMRLVEISGKSGNQDRSLSANSVFIPLIDIRKSVSPTTVNAGTQVTYTYVIKNIGEMELTNVRLEDDKLGTITLPAAANPLAVGEEVTVTVNYTPTNTDATNTPLVNIADVYGTASSGDTVTDRDTASLNVNRVPLPNVTMTKTASDTTPAIGQAFSYTVTLTNSGDADATSVTVNDAVPAEFEVTSVSTTSATGSCTEPTANNVACSNLTVPKKVGATDGSITVTINVNGPAASDCGKTKTNTATSNQAPNASVDVTTPACFSSLAMIKTASDTTPAIGQAFSYTVTLTNSGYADATGVTVDDAVPAEFEVTSVSTTSATGSCSEPTANNVACSNLTVPKKVGATDGSITVTINVNGPAASDCGKTKTNTATSNQAPDASVDVTTPACFSSLAMTKTASDTTPAIGQAFSYTVTLTNSGFADATGVTVGDVVPAEFEVTGVSTTSVTGSCTEPLPNSVTCSNLTVPKKVGATDGSITVTINANGPAASDCGKTKTNTATSNQAADASVDVTTPACFSSLAMAKTASDTTPAIGQAFSYTVTLTNSGYADATGVTVDDAVPAEFEVTSVSTTSATGSCSEPTANNVACSNLTVPKKVGATDGSITVTINVNGPAASDCGKTLTNTATSNQAPDDSVDVTTPACFAIPAMTKTASDTTPAIGQAFSYTVTLTNSGYADATGVTVDDAVPAEFEVTSVSTTSATGSCTEPTANNVACTNLTIPKKAGGTDGSITVTINVNGPAASDCGKTKTNTATSNQAADASVDVTTPACFAAVSMLKTASDTTPAIGQAFSYTVTLTNSGYADATGVTVDDAVPAEFEVTSVSTTSATGSCSEPTANNVACSNLTVPKKVGGTDGSITVTINVNGPAASDCGKTKTNTARSNSAPDSAVDVTTPACFSSLAMAKTASDTTPAIGQAFTYTITLTNSGYADATNVTVDDGVPAEFDVTGVSTTSATGSCSEPTPNAVACSTLTVPKRVGAVDGSITVTINVDGPAASDCGKTLTNTATSNQAADASVDVTTPACFSSLAMAKTASDTTPAIGQAFSYTITLTNSGYADAVAVPVNDAVPTEFDVTAVSTTSATGSCAESAATPNLVECANLTVPKKVGAVDGTITITIDVAGPAAADCDKILTNTAMSAQAPDASVDVETPRCFADVTMTKTNSNAAPALGEDFSYTVTLTNSGFADATGVALSDAVPAAFAVLGVTTTSATGACAESAATPNLVECANLTVPKKLGAVDGTITVTIAVDGPTAADCGQTLINTATSNSAQDADDTPGVTTPACVIAGNNPSIKVDKSADRDSAFVGDVITYTYVVTNTGDVTLTDLSVFDDVIGQILAGSTGKVLAPGDSLTLTSPYTATAEDGFNGKVTNVASVSGKPPVGPDVTDTDKVTVPVAVVFVQDVADLRIVKKVSGTDEGRRYTFTVDCGATSVGDDARFTLPATGGTHEVGIRIPVGSACRVVETGDGGATSTTVAVNGGAASSGVSAIAPILKDGSTVTFVNAFADAPRPLVPPADPPKRELPATGSAAVMQLIAGLAALLLGGSMVRLSRPRRRQGWLRGPKEV